MGKDIHVRIVKFNRDENVWESVRLYRKEKNELKVVHADNGRNYELFDILEGNDEDSYDPFAIAVNNLPEDLKKEIEEDSQYCYNFKEANLADLKIYLHQHPKIRDYDYDEDSPKAYKDNPVKWFIKRIEYYIDFACPWDYYPDSDIRILYWFDS